MTEIPLGPVCGTRPSLRWVPPAPLTPEDATAVAGLRSFRGSAWYDREARPWFRVPEGGFDDVGEPLAYDLASWHCLARDDSGQLMGCARVTPVRAAEDSPVLAALPATDRESVLRRIGDPATGAELGKLVVHPRHRGGPAAHVLVCLALAVARVLGRKRAWGFVATGHGQDRSVAHYGCQGLDQLREYPVYGETTLLMWSDPTAPAGRFEETVAELAGLVRPHLDREPVP